MIAAITDDTQDAGDERKWWEQCAHCCSRALEFAHVVLPVFAVPGIGRDQVDGNVYPAGQLAGREALHVDFRGLIVLHDAAAGGRIVRVISPLGVSRHAAGIGIRVCIALHLTAVARRREIALWVRVAVTAVRRIARVLVGNINISWAGSRPEVETYSANRYGGLYGVKKGFAHVVILKLAVDNGDVEFLVGKGAPDRLDDGRRQVVQSDLRAASAVDGAWPTRFAEVGHYVGRDGVTPARTQRKNGQLDA